MGFKRVVHQTHVVDQALNENFLCLERMHGGLSVMKDFGRIPLEPGLEGSGDFVDREPDRGLSHIDFLGAQGNAEAPEVRVAGRPVVKERNRNGFGSGRFENPHEGFKPVGIRHFREGNRIRVPIILGEGFALGRQFRTVFGEDAGLCRRNGLRSRS